MNKETGGPAFPTGTAFQGMTLRDYFAAKAMGMIPYPQHLRLDDYSTKHFREYTELMTQAAYEIADAMLKEREK